VSAGVVIDVRELGLGPTSSDGYEAFTNQISGHLGKQGVTVVVDVRGFNGVSDLLSITV